MALLNVQKFLAVPSIQELSKSNLTEGQWTALAVACWGNVSSGMIKAQTRCIAIQALMDSGKIDKELGEAQELLNAAEAKFINKQEQQKEKSDAEEELRRIEAEESLIKLKMQAEREREDREKRERKEREEEKAGEEERKSKRRNRERKGKESRWL
ncbi:uncharacterized protein [Macrobrachium rosenbergii]|uniref:uncharacterized protein n=1 Tax=Macrobrachium rosenbergii TaxID=79674 RepID=UPI0034D4E0D2